MTDPRITERLDRQLALRAAVLLDAIRCLVDTPNNREQAFARLAAWRWVRSRDAQAPFSFENVCESLGFDPRRVRQVILREWNGEPTGEPTTVPSIRRASVARVVRRRLGRAPSPTPGGLSRRRSA
jgi:hypothetical protein